jgi:RecA-family ATPase
LVGEVGVHGEDMMKRVVALSLLLVGASITVARGVNSYHTSKLSTTSVLVSCEDEREPVITRLENTTAIVVTCRER